MDISRVFYIILITVGVVSTFRTHDFCDVCVCRYAKTSNGVIVCDDGLPDIEDIIRGKKSGNYSLIVGGNFREYNRYKAQIDKYFQAVILDATRGIPELIKMLNSGLYNVNREPTLKKERFITQVFSKLDTTATTRSTTTSLTTSSNNAGNMHTKDLDINMDIYSSNSISKIKSTNMDIAASTEITSTLSTTTTTSSSTTTMTSLDIIATNTTIDPPKSSTSKNVPTTKSKPTNMQTVTSSTRNVFNDYKTKTVKNTKNKYSFGNMLKTTQIASVVNRIHKNVTPKFASTNKTKNVTELSHHNTNDITR